jgi:hypothetical protein
VNHKKFDYINYSNNFDQINYDLPTLIVGWNNVKEQNIESSILNKTIKEDLLYWEFEFDENKHDHVNGLQLFSKLVPFRYFKHYYNYNFIDPIFNSINTIDDLFKLIPNTIDKIYNHNEMVYLLKDENIFGINLDIMDFFSFEKEKILLFLSKKTTKFVVDNKGDIYKKYYQYFKGFEDIKKYIVTLI